MTANDERPLILRDNHSSDSDRNRGIVGKRAQKPRAAVDFSFADDNNGRGTKTTRVYDFRYSVGGSANPPGILHLAF